MRDHLLYAEELPKQVRLFTYTHRSEYKSMQIHLFDFPQLNFPYENHSIKFETNRCGSVRNAID